MQHGRLGIPMEVMGLMLGEYVDDYTVTCVDVFAMPQTGTGVSVEAVDPVFQTKVSLLTLSLSLSLFLEIQTHTHAQLCSFLPSFLPRGIF